jgi:thiol-disulfide isomerase/thioredoxin
MSAAPSARNRRVLIGGAVALGAAALGAAVAWRRLAPDEASGDAVAILLAQTLPDSGGKPFAFAQLTGHPTILNFWATWCPPCIEEMPELSELHRELNARVRMVGIGIDSPSKIAEFAARRPVSYPLVVAGMGGTELARRFGNASGALPFTVLIDRRGRVTARILGRIDLARLRPMAVALAT